MGRIQTFTSPVARCFDLSFLGSLDRADCRSTSVDFDSEVRLFECSPAIADDFAKIGVRLCIAYCERPLHLETEASGVLRGVLKVDDDIVERFIEVALLS